MGVIYRLLFPSGKSYVGLTTVSVETRWSQHKHASKKLGHCSALNPAIRKYGWNNVQKSVLKEAPIAELSKWEVHFVALYDSYHNGYNLTPVGEMSPMLVEEVRARHKAALNTAEHKARQSQWVKEMHGNEQWKADWLQKNRVYKQSDVGRKAQSEASRAQWTDSDVRQRRCDGLKNAMKKPGALERRAEGFKKRSATNEAKRKAAIKASWARRKALAHPGSQYAASCEGKRPVSPSLARPRPVPVWRVPPAR